MDINLFPEDICLAIKRILAEPPIVVPDEDAQGDKVESVIHPRYINPEPELAKLEYPSVVLFDSSYVPDFTRLESEREKLRDNEVLDEQGNLVSLDLRDYPTPHKVMIDIQVRTKFDQQRDLIRKEILRRLGSPFGGLVIDANKVPLKFMGETNLTTASSGTNQRKRVTLFRYEAKTMFDIGARNRYYVVRDVITDAKPQ